MEKVGPDFETFAYGLKANRGELRFESSGSVSFACPVDLEKTEVNGKENYWIRVRLIGGNYGTASYTPNGKMSVNSIKAPKILKISINVNIDQDHFYPLEYCITKNNLNTLSVDLSKPFQPFQVLDSQESIICPDLTSPSPMAELVFSSL